MWTTYIFFSLVGLGNGDEILNKSFTKGWSISAKPHEIFHFSPDEPSEICICRQWSNWFDLVPNLIDLLHDHFQECESPIALFSTTVHSLDVLSAHDYEFSMEILHHIPKRPNFVGTNFCFGQNRWMKSKTWANGQAAHFYISTTISIITQGLTLLD